VLRAEVSIFVLLILISLINWLFNDQFLRIKIKDFLLQFFNLSIFYAFADIYGIFVLIFIILQF